MFLNDELEYNERRKVGRAVNIDLYRLCWAILENKQGDSM
jgi:hypothetical protein